MTGGFVPVLAVPHLDPGQRRIDLDLPAGMTLSDIIATAMPGMEPSELERCRVSLVTDSGAAIVPAALWPRVRPHAGVRVVIRVVPGKSALRTILAIVVTVAAIASGQIWGAQFGAAMGLTGKAATLVGTALVSTGVSVIGTLLINALVPPVQPERLPAGENRYTISGWQNVVEPGGAVRDVLGELRVAPAFGAVSFSEIVGDYQHVRALFCLGYGPVEIDDMRIGETSLSEFDDVDVELRYGYPDDLPLTLITRQIVEEAIGVELIKPLPRDDLGEIVAGPAEESPAVRTTGADASAASVILAFPAGLFAIDDKGKSWPLTVQVRIEQRLVTGEEWQLVIELSIEALKLEAFHRQYTWSFPSRGRWQVRVTMLTDESTDTKRQFRTSWAALQTIRPEYPLAFPHPLALVAVRVKATHQISGALDSFNCLVRKICLDWDYVTETWIERATSNPASLYRHVLQSPANPRPVADSGIDLTLLQEWHDFCRLKGLTYDRELSSTNTTLRDVLGEIAAAGRATPRHDGVAWGVVIDRPDQPLIDHVSPRNSAGFRCSRQYVRYADAFRVPFLDATNDYKPAERLVPRPGFVGEPELTEELSMPGKTDPDEVYREGLRRWYEVMYRPDTYEMTQDGPVRVATRGDHVAASTDVLTSVQAAARVRRIAGRMIEVDEDLPVDDGVAYGIRFRAFADEADTIGTSVVRAVDVASGSDRVLMATGDGDMPVAGDLILFGPAGAESYRLMITRVEAADGLNSILRAVDVAPEIDPLVDAAVIPAWSGRVGVEVPESSVAPGTPRFVRVTSGYVATGVAAKISYSIEPGSGTISVSSFEIDHRLAGTTEWTTISLPAASGGGSILDYLTGDDVEMRARALSAAAVPSPYSAIISLTVGAGDADIPAALDDGSVSVTALLGGAALQFATGIDPATSAVQIYRSTSAVLNTSTDAVGEPLAVSSQQSYSVTLGDTTRSNVIAGGGMETSADWTVEAGWEVSGGVAVHSAGTADTISQAHSFAAGKYFRIGYSVAGRTAGTVTPRLIGGSDRPGAAVAADGDHLDRIQAVTGNDTFDFLASSDFDGSIDDVVVYRETSACLAQGTHYLWLEPRNADDVPGPVSGPFTITVV